MPVQLTDVTLKTAAEGRSKIYLNGAVVYAGGHTSRTFRTDADEIPGITFKEGKNLLVIHLMSDEPYWKFSLRFFDEKGAALFWQQETPPGTVVQER